MNRTFRFLIFLLILLSCWLVGRFFQVDIDYYRSLLAQYPPFFSGLIFVGVYIGLTTLIWIGPKDVLRILAAILFGPWFSTLLVTIGELGNATIFFYLSRKLGRDFVIQKFKINAERLDRLQEQTGFWWVSALRINPLIPFRFLDLGFGLSAIRFVKYFLIILIVSPFRIFWLQYVIAAVGESFLKDPRVVVVVNYLVAHPFMRFYSGFYFLTVLALTILAIVLTFAKR